VWASTSTDQEGNRHIDFADTNVTPLPPSLDSRQQSYLVASILGSLLHDLVLPELNRRYGVSVSEWEFLTSPEWQCKVRQILIIDPLSGSPTVGLNEEVAGREIPSGCGHALLLREGNQWHIQTDHLPVFPVEIQAQVRSSVVMLAEAILKGDEKSASEIARQWFPSIWEDNPPSIQKQLCNEIYVLLFRSHNPAHTASYFDVDPLDTIHQSFPKAMEDLKRDYSWESIRNESQELPGFASLSIKQSLEGMNNLFSRANLTDRELYVIRLEVALAVHGEQWSSEDKEKFLSMGQGTYKSTLYRARQKLTRRNTLQDHPLWRLLEAIFGNKAR
jgi:hypothetical protein